MTAGRGPGRSPLAALVAVLAGLLLIAGCAGVPTSSSPQAVSAVERDDGTADMPVPEPGRAPDLLVRDFLTAAAEPSGQYSAGRKFLTADAARDWDAAASVSLVDKIDVFYDERTENTASLLVRSAKVGDLDEIGVFRAEEGTLEARISLVRQGDQWLIDQLPDGVIIDRSDFLNTYHQVSLYFLDPTGSTVVADPRWLPVRSDQLAAGLIDMLIDGPRPSLADSVITELGSDVHLRSTLTRLDGRDSEVDLGFGGLRMDFQGIGGLGPVDRERLAAQLVWTLSASGIPGPYEILADGAPMLSDRTEPWTTEELLDYLPGPDGAGPDLLALRGGRMVAVTDGGTATGPWPQTERLESGAISRDGRQVAAVRRSAGGEPRVELLIGSADGSDRPTVVLAGESLTRPSWAVGRDALWTVLDDDRVMYVAKGADGTWSAAEVDARAVRDLGGDITDLAVSWDGVRIALVVGGRVFVAAAVTDGADGPRLASPRGVGFTLGDTVTALAWMGTESLVVLRSAGEGGVTMIDPEGFSVRAVSGRNLLEPLSRIAMDGETAYVVDDRGLNRMRLPSGDGDEPFWRGVPGLFGTDTAPITRG